MCSLPGSRKPLLRVAVTGGTHGNEMCGVYLARYWLQNPGELQRPSFSAMPVLANPAATAACRRYIDRDLNRTFTLTFLGSTATPDDPYEVKRAQELNQLLGPKGTCQAFDFILDLHNTTANTGACLISEVSQNPFNLHLCHYLQLQNPGLPCRLFQFEPPGTESYSMDSVSKNGISLELGPQPQGVLRAELFSQMRAMVASILDFIELFNQGMEFPAFEMEVYKNLGSVDFPRTTDGHLTGTVHSRLQDHDFEPLRPGEPIFKLFSGEDVLYEGDSVVYPLFVNEAAYYEKRVAFLKSEKIRISVPALPGLTPSSTQTP
ncbi:aspartoacylase (aminoacylase) 3, isoform CRA_c [Rattus norvegicus]|uniref:N-acyl-aromatic-L-amino acid amidohydrolase (carboxylate-forming) n=3 Tax=Rattus norvegicus TaxID=10116 RepID=ACY3_RAT|nr:N-acyl-aromatic-L-amino acid amidohydrolase (carboxylate-forming) [Rattus norvegicus]Q5M876.1 RecName: Full=N-acyl-aromatic-L-amino acid amidohydrolase (carboxylate-forming); AltName: Full=Aminoacylase-3; Short=ACY-3; AltName: Full=Aspartoacylase-2 [Rattus norvegicus]AAH88190.1 Aspartoacylase (aminocyclase) 3 [Rattus norvegicus]EDM12330.1 aspartoacylase (aminoacylase) 3, isoform CRA_c [Rattus norvegicus]EDM12331.1 aspartoacylase (aminoacylase) 3, isoform CRA_c [Rattus norvegicus]EDM12334.1 |eukprot:NP_001009603.1 N-acyl-aromatic-L-amino acid amidohydrolase (carboxylate-forming) [Rattus norvegicus]